MAIVVQLEVLNAGDDQAMTPRVHLEGCARGLLTCLVSCGSIEYTKLTKRYGHHCRSVSLCVLQLQESVGGKRTNRFRPYPATRPDYDGRTSLSTLGPQVV